MSDCINLAGCGFMKKYSASKELMAQGFVRMYCKGDKQNECKRKEYKQKNGKPPSDDMMPSGQEIHH